VLNDFKRALGRVQSDYGFYIECQANPAVALADYDLTAEERLTKLPPNALSVEAHWVVNAPCGP